MFFPAPVVQLNDAFTYTTAAYIHYAEGKPMNIKWAICSYKVERVRERGMEREGGGTGKWSVRDKLGRVRKSKELKWN